MGIIPKVLIGTGVVALWLLKMIADEIGNYCEELNPYAPEDFPKNDVGEDF